MYPVMICRHYDVKWLSSDTCRCLDCGKQGHWTRQGFSIWVRTGPPPERKTAGRSQLAKVG